MAKKGKMSGDSHEAARRQYTGRFGVESGPVPLERWKPAFPHRKPGESIQGDDNRPELGSHRRRERD